MLASVGYAASLLLQERLMSLTPEELSGHALGLHSSGMLTMQGVGAALAGAVAELTSPATAMAVMAAASVVVTVALAPGLRPVVPERQPAQDGDGHHDLPETGRETRPGAAGIAPITAFDGGLSGAPPRIVGGPSAASPQPRTRAVTESQHPT